MKSTYAQRREEWARHKEQRLALTSAERYKVQRQEHIERLHQEHSARGTTPQEHTDTPPRPNDPERDQWISAVRCLLNEGLTVDDIARTFCKRPSTIERWLKETENQ